MSGEHATSHFFRKLIPSLIGAAAFACTAQAQVPSFAGNSQHTSNYSNAAGPVNLIHWQRSIDEAPAFFGHYGAPLITAANTILVAHKTASNGFQVDAIDGNGLDKYTLTTDYVLPSFSWVPPYQPVIAPGAGGDRIYYAGRGGKIYWTDNLDSATPHTANTLVFYGDTNYNANPASFDNTVFINTPITADSAGNIYFGFRIQSGPAPAPFSSSIGGIARISATGVGSWVSATTASGDATMVTPSHGSAIAVSNDEQTIYTYLRGSSDSNAYLVGLDASTLAFKYSRKLWDPRSGNTIGARVIDVSTASPMVAPDGDVYAPIFANPYNGSRGFLLHFSGDLATQKTTGGFGWDYTPGIVPASMVPSYHGSSSYLLFCKYNNYFITDGDGINRVALLDPNETQVDFHSTAPGLVEMRQVLSIISPTPDSGGGSYPLAVREWCINASAVNPSTNSIIFNNEDGRLYRWNTVDNVLSECVRLNEGIGQPYVPTVIGPDGTIYTLNGGNIFAIGGYDNGVSFKVTSSNPNMRSVVAGDSITFTAKVIGGTGTPTGTFDFYDDTHNGLTPEHNLLASGVAVDPLGQASISVSTLSAGGSYFGNHVITAIYSGDGGHSPGEGAMLQKVHAFATSTDVQTSGSPSTFGDPVTLTATVTSTGGTPTGYATFYDNGLVIGQVFLDGSGVAQFTTSSFAVGSHSIGVEYESDTYFASSGGGVSSPVQQTTNITAGTSPNPSTFGQTVTLSADVASDNPAAGIPTGSVTWFEGATALGTGTVDGTGHASATISTLSVGSHAITAFFTGSGGYSNQSGSAGTQNVTATTSTGVSGSPNPSTFGTSVTFTATVTSGGGTPTGSVVFTIDGTPGSAVAVDGSGQATTSTSSLTVGPHSVSAAFTGTGGFGNSSSTTATQNVQANSTTTVVGSPNPSNVGQSVTFTATVVTATPGAGTPTGSVTFKDGAATIGSGTVDGTGHASMSTSSLTGGSHSISANFTGSNGWQNSSGSTNQVVNSPAGPTTTTIGSSLNPSILGQAVTFTATVVKTGGGSVPTGSVQFKNGNSNIGTVVLDGTGHAAITTSSLAQGNRTIKAIFTGTNGWGNSQAQMTQVVQPDTTPPTIPQGVVATPGPGSGKITITWNASTDPDDPVDHYDVYRATSLNGSYKKCGTSTGLSLLDNPGRNALRFYYVVAVDSNGNQSAPSAKVSATAPNIR